MKPMRPLTLSALIFTYAGALLAVFALIVGIFMQRGLAHLQENALLDKAATVSSYLSLIFREPVQSGQWDLLTRYADDLVAEYDLKYVQIADANGRVLASAGNEPHAENSLVTNRDIRVGTAKLGEVQLVCDRGRIDESAREMTLVVMGTFAGLVMLLFFVLSIMLRKLLVEPIKQLARETAPLHDSEPVFSPSWHTPREVFALHDIMKTSRDEVRAHIEELNQANKLVRATTQRLCHGQRLASIGQMAAGLAHGLNTPLGNIVGYAQRAKELSADENLSSQLDVIERQASVCTGIVRNLLGSARAPNVLLETFDLADSVQRIAALLTPLIKDYGVALEAETDSIHAWVNADVGSVEQILFNLVNNARQAGAKHIRLAVNSSGAQAVVTVCDDGPGIAPEDQNRIFDAFFTTKPVSDGTGLGLHLCAFLAASSNGSIRLKESRPGRTCFELVLKAGRPA